MGVWAGETRKEFTFHAVCLKHREPAYLSGGVRCLHTPDWTSVLWVQLEMGILETTFSKELKRLPRNWRVRQDEDGQQRLVKCLNSSILMNLAWSVL